MEYAPLSNAFGNAQAAGAGNILGPMEPMGFPRPSARDIPAGVVVGAVALACALALLYRMLSRHMRGSGAAEAPPPKPSLPENSDALSGAEFYGMLLGAVRARLNGAADAPAASLTPRELIETALPEAGGPQDDAGWGRLCARAEWTRYAGGAVDMHQRTEDLELVSRWVARMDAAQAAQAAEEA